MIERVFFAWLSIISLVVSNPVPQVFPSQYASQQLLPFEASASIPSLVARSQINPYTQHVAVQKQAPLQGNIDGPVLNEVLMRRILSNPCLQKLIDPRTKLFNQNGREVQRQPNTGTAPNVVNNYFIVPPEFFNINETKTKEKLRNLPKRRKISDRKANLTEIKTNVSEGNKDTKTPDERINKTNQKNSIKMRNTKNNQNIKTDETENNETDLKQDTIEPERAMKIKKKSKNQEPSKNAEPTDKKSSGEGPELDTGEKEVDKSPVQSITGKRRKKTKQKLIVAKKETDNILTSEMDKLEGNDTSKHKKLKSSSYDKGLKTVSELKGGTYLKNIESPVDNSETISLKENTRPVKSMKESTKAQILNADKIKKEPKTTNKQTQSATPMSDDILNNFFPYMYTPGNNYYSNGNYPFNFEQFYQPFIGRNDQKNKTNKGRNNQNAQIKKDALPKTVEVKLKPKKQQNTTTSKPMQEENTEKPQLESEIITTTVEPFTEIKTVDQKSNSTNTIANAETVDYITDIPVKEPNEELLIAPKNEEQDIKPDTKELKQDFTETKANLESPQTLIEDLYEYITPELGSEDIVPIIRKNGIINDYYPIFNDDSYYAHDESYYLRDLDDDRHFYTTDRGFQEPLNKDRRKYDKYEDYPRHHFDIKDRINFRRTYKFKERAKSKLSNDDKSYVKRPYPEIVIETNNVKYEADVENGNSNQDNNIKDQFQTPPVLENPDFRTTKIENLHSKSDIDNYGSQEPVYTDAVEEVPDVKFYFDPQPTQYSKIINFDGEVTNIDKSPTHNTPKSDRIETVFAKTRVVKYGVVKEEETTSSLPIFDSDGEKFHSDGHTTYVLAKSLGHSDDFFW